MENRIEELKNEIERIERAIFIEEMADFMDWGAYHDLKNRLNKAKAELKELAA